ncbi:MAG: EamA family transporter [Microbacterium sp.]|nr:EamA family transporter [Microbacterium sp.]
MLSVLAVVAAAVLFGTTGTAQALGPEATTPLSVGMARLVVGGTGLALIAAIAAAMRRRREGMPPRRAGRDYVFAALTAIAFVAYQPLFFLGTDRNGVAVGTVVALGSAPVLAGLLEWAVRRRGPRAAWVGATALATIGVVLLAFGGDGAAGSGADPVGLLGSLGAGASFAVFAVCQRRLLDAGWHPFTVAGWMGGGAAVIAAPLLATTDTAWLATPMGAAMALWLGLAATTLAYTLFTWGLRALPAATAATLALTEPLTASILGIAVLGERLSGLAVAGLLVLALGLALLAWSARPARDPAPFGAEG